MPVRYLPVRTPRPSGDHGSTPRPSASAAGSTSCSMPRLSREYSTWVRQRRRPAGHGPLPGRRLRGLPARVVGDADVRRPAGRHRVVERAERLLERALVDPDVHLPQVDVVDAQPLERGVEGADQVPPGRVGDPRRRVRREIPALVASTTSSRRPRRRSACRSAPRSAPSPYPAAVSTRVPPASANAISWSRASCSSVSRPQVIVPSPSRDTLRPVAADVPLLHGGKASHRSGNVAVRPRRARPRELAFHLVGWAGPVPV